ERSWIGFLCDLPSAGSSRRCRRESVRLLDRNGEKLLIVCVRALWHKRGVATTQSALALTTIINARRDEILDFTAELIATPSETPPGDERRIAAVATDRLDRLGLTGATIAAEAPERPNVLYRLKGTGGGPTLLYNAHMDTKP